MVGVFNHLGTPSLKLWWEMWYNFNGKYISFVKMGKKWEKERKSGDSSGFSWTESWISWRWMRKIVKNPKILLGVFLHQSHDFVGNTCMTVWLYDCMTVWLYDCMTVWLYDCMTVWLMTVWLYDCMTVWLYDCMTVWLMTVWLYDCMTHDCMYVCMHVCMQVCMYACMHVCMYACMHVYIISRMAGGSIAMGQFHAKRIAMRNNGIFGTPSHEPIAINEPTGGAKYQQNLRWRDHKKNALESPNKIWCFPYGNSAKSAKKIWASFKFGLNLFVGTS